MNARMVNQVDASFQFGQSEILDLVHLHVNMNNAGVKHLRG
jgi:hypothetical protein